MRNIAQPCLLFPFDGGDLSATFRTLDIGTSVVNGLSLLIATTANALVIFVIWRNSTLHSTFDVALATLASCNFVVALLVQPSFILLQVQELVGSEGGYCRAQLFNVSISIVCICVLFVLLLGITLDHYLALRPHPRCTTTVTVARLLKMSLLLWITFISMAALCAFLSAADGLLLASSITIVVLIFVLFALNLKIHLAIRRHFTQVQQQLEVPTFVVEGSTPHISRHKRTAATTTLCIFTACAMTHLPFLCTVIVAHLTGWSDSKKAAFLITTTTAYSGAALNPFIYVWRAREIRQAVSQTIASLMHS